MMSSIEVQLHHSDVFLTHYTIFTILRNIPFSFSSRQFEMALKKKMESLVNLSFEVYCRCHHSDVFKINSYV